jgi:SAM-dependent methyltransferase
VVVDVGSSNGWRAAAIQAARGGRAVAEIDRVLRDGGHLLRSDFLPDAPTRVRYHRRPEVDVWTYKQDYAQPFLASGLYGEVERIVIDHRTGQPAEHALDPRERGFISVLRKDLQGSYTVGTAG